MDTSEIVINENSKRSLASRKVSIRLHAQNSSTLVVDNLRGGNHNTPTSRTQMDIQSRNAETERRGPQTMASSLSLMDVDVKAVCLSPSVVPNLQIQTPINGSNAVNADDDDGQMKCLIDDVQNSKTSIEDGQKDYNKAKEDLAEVDKKISELQVQVKEAESLEVQLTEKAAIKHAELSFLEIRNKISEDTLKKTEQELSDVLEQLHQVRMHTSQMTSTFLAESVEFAKLWNGTPLGRNNRQHFYQNENENLKNQKRQLESELSDFLNMKRETERLEIENDELERQYKENDAIISKQEKELKERVTTLDMTLQNLHREHETFIRLSEEECQKLKRKIKETQTAVKTLEDETVAAKNTVKLQQNRTNKTPPNQPRLKENSVREENQFSVNFADTTERMKGIKFNVNQNSMKSGAGNDVQVKVETNQVKSKGILKSTRRGSFDSGDGFNSSTDEDMCLAASIVSQNVRSYEPMTPTSSFGQRPLPAKVRVIERQTPITAFMRQLSSTMKRPSKAKKSTQTPAVTKSAAFGSQFKPGKFSFRMKASTTTHDKGNLSFNSFDTTASSMSESFLNENSMNKSNDLGNEIHRVSDINGNGKPYSSFNSSRVLLSESQEKLL